MENRDKLVPYTKQALIYYFCNLINIRKSLSQLKKIKKDQIIIF